MTERWKTQSEVWTYFTQLFIYFITVNKYWFCILVIGNINMQIMGIGISYKKSISVDHYIISHVNYFNILFASNSYSAGSVLLPLGEFNHCSPHPG